LQDDKAYGMAVLLLTATPEEKDELKKRGRERQAAKKVEKVDA
jgi:hypothetical protein